MPKTIIKRQTLSALSVCLRPNYIDVGHETHLKFMPSTYNFVVVTVCAAAMGCVSLLNVFPSCKQSRQRVRLPGSGRKGTEHRLLHCWQRPSHTTFPLCAVLIVHSSPRQSCPAAPLALLVTRRLGSRRIISSLPRLKAIFLPEKKTAKDGDVSDDVLRAPTK